jgi:hypothetical protein
MLRGRQQDRRCACASGAGKVNKMKSKRAGITAPRAVATCVAASVAASVVLVSCGGDTPDDVAAALAQPKASPVAATATAAPDLSSLTNPNPLFREKATSSKDQLAALGVRNDRFTEPADPPDNGPQPTQGQFRIACQWSHFAYDDPIIYPNQPGASHLHMYWGNTATNAATTYSASSSAADKSDITQFGGSTCQAFEMNRSAYWIPAMLDRRRGAKRVVLPQSIVLYYKSYDPRAVRPFPQGVRLLAGNVGPNGTHASAPFETSDDLYWSCGSSGAAYNKTNRIPTNCRPGDPINATITFQQCLAVDASGKPVLSSPDFQSHTARINENDQCPASHPYRVPQITYLIYWPNGTDGAGAGVANWVLSSDMRLPPGASLHGDWFGGWNQEAIDLWINGCFDPANVGNGARNCSNGQTGTDRSFRRVSPLNNYEGPYFLPLPR